MNITEMLGNPVRDFAELDQPTRSECAVPMPPDDTIQPASRRHGWLWMVLVGVVALLIGLSVGVYVSSPQDAAQPPSQGAVVDPTTPPNVGGFAAMVTALQLSGLTNPADLDAMYAGTPPTPGTGGLWISRSAAVTIEPLGDDFWVVTVAVDALELVDGAYESAGIQYYESTIANGDNRPVAVTAPARVPTPASTAAPAAVPTFAGPVPADQTVAVTSFLEAYLTGRGEVARFVSPVSQIQLFTEAPYETIEIASLGSDSLGRVRAAVQAASIRGWHHNLEYTLEMTFESGVWEVSDLVAAVDDRS